jgi:SAM-dependent methyltransferase
MLKRLLRYAHRRAGRAVERIPADPPPRTCNICGQSFPRFLPYRDGWDSVSPFLRKLRTIGSDVANFGCPSCGSNDRERHLFLYFDAMQFWGKLRGAAVLHFAPERQLAPRIAGLGPREYVRADLRPAGPEVRRIDITAIPYSDRHFDFIMANHVLEHVADDARALAELHRVLRPGGFGVLQTPFSPVLQRTFEDPGIDTDELRDWFYGEDVHLRVYGRDLFERIRAAGFTVEIREHGSLFSDDESARHGVNPREDLILVHREGAAA